MVRPSHFGYNEMTAASNAFQTNDEIQPAEQIKMLARVEFDGFVNLLRSNGVQVIVAEDAPTPIKSDAIFPNNWVSFHDDGTVVLYPMMAENRRLERDISIIKTVAKTHRYHVQIDLSVLEEEEIFLEGTGSLILDRPNRLAYACVSPRTHDLAFDVFCQKMNYQKVIFSASDANGQLIYHTNVMMALSETFVVICMDSIDREEDKTTLYGHFARTNKEIVEISYEQMYAFAGNMLQVSNGAGTPFLVMSEQAYLSLNADQIQQIERHCNILHAPIYTIEKYGGGSVRCMMAEVFLPKRKTT